MTGPASRSVPVVSEIHMDADTRRTLPRYAWRRVLNAIACERRVMLYQDPFTNDLVHSTWYLQEHPDKCCHVSERHCPHLYHESSIQKHQDASLEEAVGSKVPSSNSASSDESLSDSSSSSSGSVSSASRASSERRKGHSNEAVYPEVAVTRGAGVQSRGRGSRQRGGQQQHAVSGIMPPCLRPYSSPLTAGEIDDIEDIKLLPRYVQHARLHEKAVAAGRDCYRDLATGCLMFTRNFLSKAPCCGEDCRHCPYGRHKGRTSAGCYGAAAAAEDRPEGKQMHIRMSSDDESGGSSSDTDASCDGLNAARLLAQMTLT